MSYSKSAFAFKNGRGVGDKACKVAFYLLGSFDILFWVGGGGLTVLFLSRNLFLGPAFVPMTVDPNVVVVRLPCFVDRTVSLEGE